jgi:hypothetical protein
LKDGVLKDLQIAEKKRNMIDPQDVKDFLKGFGVSLSST